MVSSCLACLAQHLFFEGFFFGLLLFGLFLISWLISIKGTVLCLCYYELVSLQSETALGTADLLSIYAQALKIMWHQTSSSSYLLSTKG